MDDMVCVHSGKGAPLLARKTTRQHWNFGGGNDQRNGLWRLYYERNQTHKYQGIVMGTVMCWFFMPVQFKSQAVIYKNVLKYNIIVWWNTREHTGRIREFMIKLQNENEN